MSDFDLAVRTPSPAPANGLAAVSVAFKRALVSQCHPKMLLALFMPFLIVLLGAIILLWAFWTPLTGWLNTQAVDWDIVNNVDQWMLAIGLFSIKLYLIPMLAIAILLPLSGILGLIIAAIFVMPIALRHLERREYKGLVRRGEFSTTVSAWNAIWVGVIFAVGWVVTMPLWIIPPIALAAAHFLVGLRVQPYVARRCHCRACHRARAAADMASS